jgi:hypothetical protein
MHIPAIVRNCPSLNLVLVGSAWFVRRAEAPHQAEVFGKGRRDERMSSTSTSRSVARPSVPTSRSDGS